MTRKEREDAIKFFKEVAEREVNNAKYSKLAIEALEQESCDGIVNKKLGELFERVENIEKQIKEDKEEQLKKLKAEVDYAKFRCALPTIIEAYKG